MAPFQIQHLLMGEGALLFCIATGFMFMRQDILIEVDHVHRKLGIFRQSRIFKKIPSLILTKSKA
jgi:hypothetical protein